MIKKDKRCLLKGFDIMKILMFVPSLSTCNGVASFAVNYAKQINNINDVHIDFLLAHDIESPYYKDLKSINSNIYFLPETKNPFIIKNYLKKFYIQNRYDIVHSNVINLGAYVLKEAKKSGIKHRIMHSHVTQNGETFMQRLIRLPFQKNALHYTNEYFACSEAAGKFMFKNKKFRIINNGIDIEKFKYNEAYNEEIRNIYKIDASCKVIGHIGRFTEQKNHKYLIDIFNEVHKIDSNIKLLLVGDGNLENQIKNKVTNLKLNDYVIFAGLQTNIFKYYSAMDVFVLPSLYEGLPVVGIEAQSSGLSCLLSDKITTETKISENTFFKSIELSPIDWAKSIIELIYQTHDRLNINKSLLNSEYDISYQASRLVDFYRQIINN